MDGRSVLFILIALECGTLSNTYNVTCPPGTFNTSGNQRCQCGDTIFKGDGTALQYPGIAYCTGENDSSVFQERAVVRINTWAGYWNVPDNGTYFADEYFVALPCLLNHCSHQYDTRVLLPQDPNKLDHFFCARRKRTGSLCSQCKKDYSVSINKPFECVQCGVEYSQVGVVFLWLGLEVLPELLLVGVFLFFDIPLLRGQLNSFLLFAHTFRNQNYYTTGALDVTAYGHDDSSGSLSSWINWVYSIWSLDFFTSLPPFPPLCLTEGLTDMDFLMFKYISALLPVALCLLALLVQYIYSKEPVWCRCIFKAMQTCHGITARVQLALGKTISSLRNGLASFLLLVYSKISYISFFFLSPISFSSLKSTEGDSLRVYLDPSMEMFDKRHISYAVPAVLILAFFVILPAVVLIIYKPCIYLASKLRKDRVTSSTEERTARRAISFRMIGFLDKYTECFQERYYFFGGLFFFYRALSGLIYSQFKTVDQYIPQIILTSFYLVLTVACKPYKKSLHWLNTWDCVIYIIILIINCFSLFNYQSIYYNLQKPNEIYFAFQQILILVPMVYLVAMTAYYSVKYYRKRKKQKRSNSRFMQYGSVTRNEDTEMENSGTQERPESPNDEDDQYVRENLLFTTSLEASTKSHTTDVTSESGMKWYTSLSWLCTKCRRRERMVGDIEVHFTNQKKSDMEGSGVTYTSLTLHDTK